MREILAKRVDKGIEYLNGHNPGWLDKVDLESLNLGQNCNCILGQLYGHYSNAHWANFGEDVHEGYGMKFWANSSPENYALLTSIWKEKIQVMRESRRAAI
jgi:hypothetical protein